MAYTPREIKDRVAVGDDIFIVEDLGNNRIRLIPAPTHVLEPGTPVNKALLQPIEDYLATFGDSSKTSSGYVWLPGGLLLQWGRSNHINADSSATVNFPIPFPNQCLQVVATKFNSSTANDDAFCTVQGFSNTSVTFRMEEPSFGSISGNRYAVYFAIGY